jgi:hypothetical protein
MKGIRKGTGDFMAQNMVKHVCEHCGATYGAPGSKAGSHCVFCFSCEQYKPFNAMYGRVGGMGYCCRECEAREQVSTHLIFEVVLNLPFALILSI